MLLEKLPFFFFARKSTHREIRIGDPVWPIGRKELISMSPCSGFQIMSAGTRAQSADVWGVLLNNLRPGPLSHLRKIIQYTECFRQSSYYCADHSFTRGETGSVENQNIIQFGWHVSEKKYITSLFLQISMKVLKLWKDLE